MTTRLAGVSDFSRDNLGTALEENLVEFLRWGLVNAGAFVEVPVLTPGTADPYGDEKLFPVHLDGVADGRVWQARHPDWCFETGLDVDPGPTVASGVYVAGQFHPGSEPGQFQHSLDFIHGRVTFANPLLPSAVVQVAYSYHRVRVFRPDQPWFSRVVLGDFGVGQSGQLDRTGVIQLLSDSDVSPPLVVVQSLMERSSSGYELGLGASLQRRPVLFFLVAEDGDTLKNLADAISLQERATLTLFDVNARRAAGDYPLDFRGTPIPGGPGYPDLVARYPLASLFFSGASGADVSPALPLFRGTIRLDAEVLHGGA